MRPARIRISSGLTFTPLASSSKNLSKPAADAGNGAPRRLLVDNSSHLHESNHLISVLGFSPFSFFLLGGFRRERGLPASIRHWHQRRFQVCVHVLLVIALHQILHSYHIPILLEACCKLYFLNRHHRSPPRSPRPPREPHRVGFEAPCRHNPSPYQHIRDILWRSRRAC